MLSITTGLTPTWQLKDNLECKDDQNELVNGNVLNQAWAAGGEHGQNVRITPRSNSGGNNTVCNDIVFSNNQVLNGNVGFLTGGFDDECGNGTGPSPTPGCTNPAQTTRLLIQNNLVVTRDQSLAGASNTGSGVWATYFDGANQTNFAFLHNTIWNTGTQGSGINDWALFSNLTNGAQWIPFYTIANGGSGYAVNDTFTITSPACSSPNLPTGTVKTVSGGAVTSFINGGYYGGGGSPCFPAPSTTYSNLATTATKGSGAGMTITAVTSSGGDNAWYASNVMFTANFGTGSHQGTAGLTGYYMVNPTSSPNDISYRYVANWMGIISGKTSPTYPGTNGTNYKNVAIATSPSYYPAVFLNSNYATSLDYTLASPFTVSSGNKGDGVASGANFSQISTATAIAYSGNNTGGGSSLAYVAPTSLSSGTQSTAYGPVSVTASGGTAPYSCALTSGSWPSGITLSSCVISGTPTVNGTFTGIVITVTDSAGSPASVTSPTMSLTIQPAAPSSLGVKVSSNITMTSGVTAQ